MATLRHRCVRRRCETLLQHPDRLATARTAEASLSDAEQPRERARRRWPSANSHELVGVAGVRDREVGHQQVVRARSVDTLHAQRRRRAGRARSRAGRMPAALENRTVGRIRRARLGEPGAADPRAGRRGSAARRRRRARVDLAWKARSTPCGRRARWRSSRLELDAHDVAREPLELEPLGLGAAAGRRSRIHARACAMPSVLPRDEAARCSRLRPEPLLRAPRRAPWITPFGRRAVVRQRPARDLGVDHRRPAGGERGARTPSSNSSRVSTR